METDKAMVHPQWKYSQSTAGTCKSDLATKDLEAAITWQNEESLYQEKNRDLRIPKIRDWTKNLEILKQSGSISKDHWQSKGSEKPERKSFKRKVVQYKCYGNVKGDKYNGLDIEVIIDLYKVSYRRMMIQVRIQELSLIHI